MDFMMPVNEARRNLGELINQAFYQGKPFVLKRGNKPMAFLLGANEFPAFIRFLEKENPGLADTLAIMADPDIQKLLEEGDEDIKAGRIIPFDERLVDK